MSRAAACRLTGLLLYLIAMPALQSADISAPQSPRSGFDFLGPDLQRLQDDEFANPGMLWVQRGERLWDEPVGTPRRSCRTCHGGAQQSMRAVAARFPAYSEELGTVIDLEQQISRCRTARLGAEALAYDSQEMLALSAFISHQAKGLPVQVRVDGPAAGSFERGKAIFYRRLGQLNLSCANCHEQHVGSRLHGETISQGQINGFPIYRELWQTMGSAHRMFAWCNEAVRAEPYPAGSQEYVDLELFERWRGRGLAIETPAIRR